MFPYGLGGMASRFAYNIPSYGFNQPAWQQFGSQAQGGQQYQAAGGQQAMPFGNLFGSPFQWGGGFRQPSPFQYAQQQPSQQPQQFAGNGLYQNRLNSPGAMDAVTQLLQSLQAMKQNRYQHTAQQPVQQPAPGGQQMYRGEYDGFSGRYLDNGQPMLMGRR